MGAAPHEGRGLVLPSVLCLHLLQVQQQRPHLPWHQWRFLRRPIGVLGREACSETSTHGGRPGGDGGRGCASAKTGRGPAALALRGPGLGWLRSWYQILPEPCEVPRPVPFWLGCSVAALVFTPVPQHLHSLIGSPDLQGLLLENGAWCWPSSQLPREALRRVSLTGPGKARTPPGPRMLTGPGPGRQELRPCLGALALLPLQRGLSPAPSGRCSHGY